ncbi:MAG TPA: hypothetical protein VI997_01695 [Candidatus Thermoplasmatota archaeon]|nr:hypothetical protein [Candidatus Thermoplasmatota archaeon]
MTDDLRHAARENLAREDRERFALLRRGAFQEAPPGTLQSYAIGPGKPTALVRGTTDDKLRFEDLRALVRSEIRFPVTQLGMFALLVRLAEARRDELIILARADVSEAIRER